MPPESAECGSIGSFASSLAEVAKIIARVGNLMVQKAPALIVRSLSERAQEHRHTVLAMAGISPMMLELQELAKASGVGDRVFFLGYRPGLQVMAACDVYTMTSHYESLACVLLEALPSGLPIVTTRNGFGRAT